MRLKAASEKKGGRKKASIASPELEENLREVIHDHTAGDPAREDVVWTYLSPPEIAEQLETRGTPVCADTVRDLLDELGFVHARHKSVSRWERRRFVTNSSRISRG